MNFKAYGKSWNYEDCLNAIIETIINWGGWQQSDIYEEIEFGNLIHILAIGHGLHWESEDLECV